VLTRKRLAVRVGFVNLTPASRWLERKVDMKEATPPAYGRKGYRETTNRPSVQADVGHNSIAQELPPVWASCFSCKNWIGKRKRDMAWCHKLQTELRGSQVCAFWERRYNARMPNAGGNNLDADVGG
jgi:hypothetical protein